MSKEYKFFDHREIYEKNKKINRLIRSEMEQSPQIYYMKIQIYDLE